MKNIKAIVFDAYGTLFDVNSANDEKHGDGTIIYVDGNKFEGKWKTN